MRLFILSLLLVGPLAHACPNLSGAFTCVEDDFAYELTVSQSTANNVTTYHTKFIYDVDTFDQNVAVADGVKRTTRDDSNGSMWISDETHSCVDEALVSETLESFEEDSEILYSYGSRVTAKINSDGDFVQENIDFDSEGAEELATLVCTRQ